MGLLLGAALFDDPPTFLGVTLAWISPLMLMAGARPQAPMQATTSRLNMPSRRGLPGCNFSVRVTASSTLDRALDVAGGPAAQHDVVLALGREAKLVVEGRNAVDLTGRQFQVATNLRDGFLGQVAVGFLSLLQDRDQTVSFGRPELLKERFGRCCSCCCGHRCFLFFYGCRMRKSRPSPTPPSCRCSRRESFRECANRLGRN